MRAEGQWRFSQETLERLSAISAAIQHEVSEEDVDLQVGPALRSPRATMGTFLNAMNADPPDLERAADCLEPPHDPTSAWAVIRHDDAYRLYNVLLRVRALMLSDIPEHPQGRRYIWHLHEDGRIVLARMEQDDPDLGVWHGEWRFSRSTLATLADLYEVHAYDPILPEIDQLGYTERMSLGLSLERRIPEVLRVEALGLAIWKWFGILCLLILAVIVFGLGELGARFIYARLGRIRQIEAGTEDIERMSRAFGWLLMFSMLYRFIATNTLLLPAGLLTFIYPFSGAMALAAFALFGLRLVQISEHHYKGSKRVANILLLIFFEVPDWPTELRERHRFLIDALALVADLGIELAYPTQRLLIEEVDDSAGGERSDGALPGRPEREGTRRARKLFAATYGDPPKDRGPVVMGESPLTAGFDDEGDDEGGDGDQ